MQGLHFGTSVSLFYLKGNMLTLKKLREDPESVIAKLKIKNFDASPIVEKVLELDSRRRALQTQTDELLSKQKQKAAEIGSLMKQGLKD